MGWGALIAAGVALAAQIISSQMEGAEEESAAERAKKAQLRAGKANFWAQQAEKHGHEMTGLRAAMERDAIDKGYESRMKAADGVRARGWVNGGIQAAGLLGRGYDVATGPSYTPTATDRAIDSIGNSMNLAQGAAQATAPPQQPNLIDPHAVSPTDYLEFRPITGQQYGDDNPLWQRRIGFGYR